MLHFIKQHLQKIYQSVSSALASFVSNKQLVDERALKELEQLLLSADTGIKTTRFILKELKQLYEQDPKKPLKQLLEQVLLATLDKGHPDRYDTAINPRIQILVGVNGCGKTTFAAKLAHQHIQQGKRVLLVAADTFRAAAPEQLDHWAQATGATIERGTPGQDPASVIFAACKRFKTEQFDQIIIDTAGRLQTKANLMSELAKLKRVVSKQLDEPTETLLTVDSMLGQNSFEQAHLFKEATDVNGIILTKMDGTAKGGIVFAIAHELHIPLQYLSYGEQIDQYKLFEKKEYVHELLNA